MQTDAIVVEGQVAIQVTGIPTGLGGGECVVLTDPSGFTVEAIHGQEHTQELPRRAPLPFNVGDAPLRINGTVCGQIAADNAISRREFSRESLEALTLLGGLASQALAYHRLR